MRQASPHSLQSASLFPELLTSGCAEPFLKARTVGLKWLRKLWARIFADRVGHSFDKPHRSSMKSIHSQPFNLQMMDELVTDIIRRPSSWPEYNAKWVSRFCLDRSRPNDWAQLSDLQKTAWGRDLNEPTFASTKLKASSYSSFASPFRDVRTNSGCRTRDSQN